MARMLPPYCSEDVKSSAERRLFEMLQSDPDSASWICLHSLGLSKHTNQMYGEIDFVVLVPQEGVFCLEVKGGRVARNGGKWTFTNRYGETAERTKSPFIQARDGMFSLRDAIERKFGKQHRISNLAFGFGVLFPDITWDQHDPEHEQWQVFDRTFRRPISGYILQLARYTHDALKEKHWYSSDDARPSLADVTELADFLRGDFEILVRPATTAESVDRELVRLTNEQYRCLDALQANPRCLYEGGAGTGKTLLAMEYARRELFSHRRVLFLCYNRLLGQWIHSILNPCEHAGIHVDSFHRYLDQLIARSSHASEFVTLRTVSHMGSENNTFFKHHYPLFALDALVENVIEPFDTLVIDEGQDIMCSEYLDVLELLVSGGLAEGKWAIFCDFHRQAIYTEATGNEMLSLLNTYSPHFARYSLTINCRNTRPIMEETAAMSGFDVPPSLPGKIDGMAGGCPKLSGKLGGGTSVHYAAIARFSSSDTSFFSSFRPSPAESIHKSL